MGPGVDLNLKSIFLCSRPPFPRSSARAAGGSSASAPWPASARCASSPPYSAAKAGVHSLTRVLAFELGKHGVTANAIAPGTTATERMVAVRSQEQRDMIGKGTRSAASAK